jgi:hypothetical protein
VAQRLALCVAMALGLASTPARAGEPPTRTMTLLTVCPTPAALRARLATYADSTRAGDAYGAAEARYEIGRSYFRAGLTDSAIINLEEAMALRGADEERLALVTALEARGAPADLERAIGLIRASLAGNDIAAQIAYWRGHLAWALFLAGRQDSAWAISSSVASDANWTLEWQQRFGLIAAAHGDGRGAFMHLLPVARAARGKATDVTAAIARVSAGLSSADRSRVDRLMDHLTTPDDEAERGWLARTGASRLDFKARDGFPLGSIVFSEAAVRRPRAAIVVMAPGDSLAGHDSLSVALTRAGLAVLLLEPRGSGHSVAPSCPLPWAWRGREEKMESAVAHDVLDALRALARQMPIDTSAYVVAGIGPTVGIAIDAGTLDPRARALLLVSPEPPPGEQGRACARLAKMRRPVFFQTSPEDAVDWFDVIDALYQSGNRAASRQADATGMGRRAIQFRYDPTIAARFRRWLEEVMPERARHAPRPEPPRRG